MATAIALNDIWQLTVWTQQGAQAGLNVGRFKITDVTGDPDMETLVNNILESWKLSYRPWLTTAASLSGVIARRLAPNATLGIQSTTGPYAGTGGSDPLAAQIAGMVTLTSPFPGRKARGRKYVPFGDESNTTTAFAFNAGGITQLTSVGECWSTVQTFGAVDTAEFSPVLSSRSHPTVTIPITGQKVREYMTRQNRRGVLGPTNVNPF